MMSNHYSTLWSHVHSNSKEYFSRPMQLEDFIIKYNILHGWYCLLIHQDTGLVYNIIYMAAANHALVTDNYYGFRLLVITLTMLIECEHLYLVR